ncbi:NAD(+) hydrolase sarm1-like [Haliotis rufescens]|uniref:NAD(+) hydrolase sarm1-like n=1 Tax=Haliotis rufescens TaxID=6454 RepID=UPI001EB0AAB3|nr:NAD(+) hydrolase sarm1-like [Haliotis rufescens]
MTSSNSGGQRTGTGEKGTKVFDPTQTLERSQSDAILGIPKVAVKKRTLEVSLSADSAEEKNDKEGRVSESSKVYFNLSEVGPEKQFVESKDLKIRLKLTPALEPILQEAEDDTVQGEIYQDRLLLTCGSDTFVPASPDSDEFGNGGSFYAKYPLRFPHGSSLNNYRHNLKLSYQTLSQKLEGYINDLKSCDLCTQCAILVQILDVVKEAWDTPVYGRDLAYGLCDIIRMEGLLDRLVYNCASPARDLLSASANLLEQVMSTKNRERVAKIGLIIIVKMTKSAVGDNIIAKATTGILENLFKLSEDTCCKVITLGGLDVILHWCRCSDNQILRRCAKALANLSLFGGAENQEEMAKRRVPEWLFPLAFNQDNSVRYYACLAISALVANKELEAAVLKSGTLDLVLPFINSNKPSVFAQSDLTHKQGRDKIWLKHLIPLLFSRRQEAQALAAFHFAMEATIKAEQGRQEIFHEICAVQPLKKIASSPNAVASKLAAEALKVIGEKIPHRLSQQVPLWTVNDVSYWVSQVGFSKYSSHVEEAEVDGDLLLILNDDDLREGLQMTSSIVRKRFLRELKSLKISADYTSCDATGLDPWLMSLTPDLSQYTYYMLRQGVDKFMLRCLSEDELKCECGINNSIHRRKIIQNLDDLSSPNSSRQNLVMAVGDLASSLGSGLRANDVFLSYRRSNGSQLASLLKVHLQLRGFSVFLDIDRLRAGKFDENLLLSIHLSRNFILILTPNSLDRCIGDSNREDWVHKEIVAALESNCNIVPIMDGFEWPPLDQLPDDMRAVVRFNCVRWVHDYQDACVDKLETFLTPGSGVHGCSSKHTKPLSHQASTQSTMSSPSQDDAHLRPSDCLAIKSHTSSHSLHDLV